MSFALKTIPTGGNFSPPCWDRRPADRIDGTRGRQLYSKPLIEGDCQSYVRRITISK
jgi:hypothetical protein